MQAVACPIVPMPGYVVVKPSESENKSRGGIIITDGAQERPTRGVVCAVGEHSGQGDGFGYVTADHTGDTMACLPLASEEVVVYGKYAGSEIDVEGEKFVVLSAKDVIAKVVP